MRLIAIKELLNLLYSPKFIILSIASFVLISIALLNGYAHYDLEHSIVAKEQEIIKNEMKKQHSFRYLRTTVVREPEKLSIFDTGVTGFIGRRSSVGSWTDNTARGARYSEDPILAVFGELDLLFIVSTVLSLFAILFSYNAVSGERESGTLQLVMSNRIRRTSVIIGKLIGGYIPLALILIIPFLLGLISLQVLTDINFSSQEWIRLTLTLIAYLIYLLVFYTLGLAMSAITRVTFVSFILTLVAWVFLVGIVPKVSIHIASHMSPSMSAAELSKRWRTISNTGSTYAEQLKEYFDNHSVTEEQYKKDQRKIWDQINKENKKEHDKIRKRVYSEYNRLRRQMVETAFMISRISPSSCLEFTSHRLNNTGPLMIESIEENLEKYDAVFKAYIQAKLEEVGDERKNWQRPYTTTTAEDGTMKATLNENFQDPELDLAGMPKFTYVPPTLEVMVNEAIVNIANLLFYAIIFFVIAYVAFLRYDVRQS